MKQYDFVQVLWVEDDPIVTEAYPYEAEVYGLQLVPYPCWDDAREALEKEYDRWSAIILDAKCKFHKDSTDNAVVFLREALKDISVIAKEKHRTIPWYILSGGDTSEITDCINDDRLIWDKEWTDKTNKNYYSKNTDREDLYHNIKEQANKSQRLQIQEMYSKIFDAVKECDIDNEVNNLLEDLLIPIHFPNEISNSIYNDRFKNVRIILEYIFRSMGCWGIIPDWGEKVNLRWSVCLLSGLPAKKYDGSTFQTIYRFTGKKQILPKIIADFMKVIIDTVSTTVHSENENRLNKKATIPSYLPQVNHSTYLLKSYSLQLCDIILWYRNYLRNHKDIEKNMKNWEKL